MTPTSDVVIRPGERAVQVERAPTVVASPVEHREEMIKHRTTNTGAMAAIAVGVAGLNSVLTQVRYIPYPFSDIIVLVVWMILVAIGASMVSHRVTTTT